MGLDAYQAALAIVLSQTNPLRWLCIRCVIRLLYREWQREANPRKPRGRTL